jgi:biotin operon repressor
MGYKPETLATYAAIADLAKADKSADEIMEALSLTRTMVYRGLRYADIKLERDIDKSLRLIQPFVNTELSQAEIARQTGLSTTTVWRIINLLRSGQTVTSNRQPYRPKVVQIPDLDPLWAAEFRGFFYGEGSATLDNEHNHLSPRLTINLRLDDARILSDIQARLGGALYTKRRSGREHDQCRWTATGWPRCREVLEKTGLTDGCLLPAKKCRDMAILYEAIRARYQMPYLLRDEDRSQLLDYYHRLQEVKRYQL